MIETAFLKNTRVTPLNPPALAATAKHDGGVFRKRKKLVAFLKDKEEY
jgi:hypothetical protein